MNKENLEQNIKKSIIKHTLLVMIISNSFSGYYTQQKLNQGWDQDQIENNVQIRCQDKLGAMANLCSKGTYIGRKMIYYFNN